MARRKRARKPRPRPERTARIDKPLRTEQSRGGRAEVWQALPIEPGDTQAGWVRRRARRGATSVNARDDLPWSDYAWLGTDDWGQIACTICGTQMSEERFGVTWDEGEKRVQRSNISGGFRTRGPVLWAMRVIKFERFGDHHLVCEATYPDPRTRPPPDIAWLCIWGDACDLAQALYAQPSLISEYWEDWQGREDVWRPAVRRRLLKAYKAKGDDGVRALLDAGVAFRGQDSTGKKVSMTWEIIPF